MAKIKDVKGYLFGCLVTQGRVPVTNKYRHSSWTCLCKCGKLINVPLRYLTRGSATDCGCGCSKEKLRKHG